MQFRTALTEEEFEDYKLAKKEGFTDDEFNEMLKSAGRMAIDLSKPFSVLKSRRPVKRLKELEKFRQKAPKVSDEARAKADVDLGPPVQAPQLAVGSSIPQNLPPPQPNLFGSPSVQTINPLFPGANARNVAGPLLNQPVQPTSSMAQGQHPFINPLLFQLFGRR